MARVSNQSEPTSRWGSIPRSKIGNCARHSLSLAWAIAWGTRRRDCFSRITRLRGAPSFFFSDAKRLTTFFSLSEWDLSTRKWRLPSAPLSTYDRNMSVCLCSVRCGIRGKRAIRSALWRWLRGFAELCLEQDCRNRRFGR